MSGSGWNISLKTSQLVENSANVRQETAFMSPKELQTKMASGLSEANRGPISSVAPVTLVHAGAHNTHHVVPYGN